MYLILAALILSLLFGGCTTQITAPGADVLVKNVEPVICGEPEVFTLWGGKTIDVGTVTVSNDEDNLYVKYETTGDWFLKEVQLYVECDEPTERLVPGQAPYKSGDISYTTSYKFTVPLAEVECELTCDETTLWLQAHAAVAEIVDNEEVDSQTAYGGDINPNASPWYGNIEYTVQCCDIDIEECYEFEGETAWADGARYVAKGNWAMYVAYDGNAKTVNLIAGQLYDVGDVTFSAQVDGEVEICIELDEGWEFEDVDENVKVQDYAEKPTGNPSPGLFAYKMTANGENCITVPVNNFYGVHVNVGQWVEVECPTD